LLVLYAIPLVVTLRPVAEPIIDPDIWWHLRVGQWVVEHQAVPDIDPFSLVGRPWVAYSWLYEVIVFALYSAFGLWGVILYRAALALAIVAALHHLVTNRERRFPFALGLLGAAVLALAMLFSERPWLCTVLFSILTLDVVLDLRRGRRSALFWALPVVYVLWGNIHIQFVYGLFLLGLGCLAPLLDRFRGVAGSEEGADRLGSANWKRLVGLTVVCTLATLVNPYHVRLYGVVLEYATQPGPFRFVNELRALEFREVCDWVVLALLAGAVFVLGRRKQISAFDVLLLAAAAFFTFRARRDLWFGCLAALSVLTLTSSEDTEPQACCLLDPGRLLRAGILLLGLVVVAVALAWGRDLSPAKLEEAVERVFPARAVRFVREQGYPGTVYNDFNWGGFLIWTLPEKPVPLDGRTNLHGDERILRFGKTWAGLPGWDTDPDLTAAGVVIAGVDQPLTELLRRDPRFRAVYEDKVARVFVPNH
jgi:hypothetical protein